VAYRELAAARPAAFRPDLAELASALNNLSLRLADLGRREDALAAIGEAVDGGVHRHRRVNTSGKWYLDAPRTGLYLGLTARV